MNKKNLVKSYLPMSETALYILLSLTSPRHGYGIIKFVTELTKGRIRLGSGTVYGTLNRMSRDGLISIYADKERKTVYEITNVGSEVLNAETQRIKMIYNDIVLQEVGNV